MDRPRRDRVRFLVVGESGAGKSALVRSLCGGAPAGAERRTVGCRVSVRRLADGAVEEFYDVCGGARFARSRGLFYGAGYDGVLLVHDLCEPESRGALARAWVPEVMGALGDVKRVDAGGRGVGEGMHARSAGVVNEMRVLWMCVRAKHGGVGAWGGVVEGVRLVWRLGVVLLSEMGVWVDEGVDACAERELLGSSRVPVAIVGMKRDLAGGWAEEQRGVPVLALSAGDAAGDAGLRAFLRRAGEHARRRGGLAAGEAAASGAVAIPM